MSHDLSIMNDNFGSVYSVNMTYNYQPIFELHGMKSLSNLGGLRGDVALSILYRMITHVDRMSSERFNEVVRGHGEWGKRKHLLSALHEIVGALEASPQTNWIVVD